MLVNPEQDILNLDVKVAILEVVLPPGGRHRTLRSCTIGIGYDKVKIEVRFIV